MGNVAILQRKGVGAPSVSNVYLLNWNRISCFFLAPMSLWLVVLNYYVWYSCSYQRFYIHNNIEKMQWSEAILSIISIDDSVRFAMSIGDFCSLSLYNKHVIVRCFIILNDYHVLTGIVGNSDFVFDFSLYLSICGSSVGVNEKFFFFSLSRCSPFCVAKSVSLNVYIFLFGLLHSILSFSLVIFLDCLELWSEYRAFV